MSEYMEQPQQQLKQRFIFLVKEEWPLDEQPEASFEDQKRRLREFLDARKQTVPDTPEYFSFVEKYNETLNDMLDKGLSAPLEDELLLDEDLLSDRYLEFEKNWNKEHHPFTIKQIIERSAYACLIAVSQVEGHTVRASVRRRYKGELPDEIKIDFYIPWGMIKWYMAGERAIVFLDEDYISLGRAGRMPLIERDGREYAVSYQKGTDFWPDDIPLKQESLDGQSVFLIELSSLETIIRNHVQERVSIHPSEAGRGEESPREAIAQEHLEKLQPNEEGRATSIRSASSDALRECYKGRRLLKQVTKNSLNRAKKHFRRAIEVDASLAEAHSGLAASYVAAGIYNIESPKDSFGEAIKHAKRAIELDNSLAEAHTCLAYVYMCYDWNWKEAEKECNLAFKCDPDYALALQCHAHWLGAMGGFPDALDEIDRALSKAPGAQMPEVVQGFILYYAKEYQESWDKFLRMIERDKHFDAAYYGLALASEPLALDYMEKGDDERAKEMFDAAKDAARNAVDFSNNNPVKLALQAHVYALSGEADKAKQELQRLNDLSAREYVSPFQLATIYAAMVTTCGALEKPRLADEYYQQALDYLELAYEKKDQWLALLNVETRFTILKDNERFKDLIRKLNFPSRTMTGDATEDDSDTYQTYSEQTPQE